MLPLHITSKDDFEISFEKICFDKIDRVLASKTSLATGVLHFLDKFTQKVFQCKTTVSSYS